jgi:hypothetical protein
MAERESRDQHRRSVMAVSSGSPPRRIDRVRREQPLSYRDAYSERIANAMANVTANVMAAGRKLEVAPVAIGGEPVWTNLREKEAAGIDVKMHGGEGK